MTTYREAGVDIDEGDRLVELIKPLAHSTTRPEVLAGVGGFGGLFAIPPGKYKEPVLVSGTDGVGTKLKLAFMAGRHDTVGIDLVAMSVNDIAVSGAEPLFFLDYFATSRLNAEQGAQVIKGIAAGCKESGCVLIGGETAEMPGFYEPGEYDLAGFAVGVVERSKIVDGRKVRVGDAILGVASTGPHSNGYSLVRRILEKRGLALDSRPAALGGALLADVLLAPTKLYPLPILALLEAVDVRAMAHITGGGLPGNVPRTMPDDTRAVLDSRAWKRPAIFEFLGAEGQVPEDEMYRTFNMGVGLTVIVPKSDVAAALKLLADRGLSAWEIGEVASGSGEATVEIK